MTPRNEADEPRTRSCSRLPPPNIAKKVEEIYILLIYNINFKTAGNAP